MDLPDLSLEELLITCNIKLESSMGQFFEYLYNKGIRCKFSGKFLVIPCMNGDYILLSFDDKENKRFINIFSSNDKFENKINLDPDKKDEIYNFITHTIQAARKLTASSRLNNKPHPPSQMYLPTTPATPMTWAKLETLLDKLLADKQMS